MFDLSSEYYYPTPYAASPLLPLILLAMAGQKHSPDTTTDISEEYDYIVVGAGSAGSVVASRLSEKGCVTVLLLEAGKSPPQLTDLPVINRYFTKTDLDWNFQTVAQENAGMGLINKTFTLSAGKAIGGSSIINGLQSARGNRKDYDNWAAQGATGWSYEEVLPYFKKLENNTDPEFVRNGYHGINGPVTMSRPKYDSELKIAVAKAAKQMGYDFTDSNGPQQKGFYDLQATMRNGQRCSAAKAYLVPNENKENLDIVKNAFVTKIIIEDRQARGVEVDLNGISRKVTARREVILSAGTINSAKLLMLSGIGPKEELQKHKYHKAIYEPYKEKPFYWCLCQILHPKGRGYVALRSSDPYDSPIIDPKYFSHPDDIKIVVAGMKKCKEIGKSEPLVEIGSKLFSTVYPGCENTVGDDDKNFRCMARSILITSNHQVGTVKMGDPKDPSTVLDPQLRVKTIRNLRVVDASVMPNSLSGNTNVPTMMIGEKASDMIKESIHCNSDNELNA
ncbi:unnamed protein product [Larinioides sclopetarius]|uniref:Glucose dehydrogenase [FAD, quinone]-like n=1 Tax=Larinioides sclopetarius TaxID=280406 RepID=A0AAV1ZP36_9ARAC